MNIFSHIFVVNIVIFAFEKTKINEKGAGIGPFFNKHLYEGQTSVELMSKGGVLRHKYQEQTSL